MAKTIVVWGADNCPDCDAMTNRLKTDGHIVSKKDLERELIAEDPMVRMEVMEAYSQRQAFPVFQVGEKAYTPEEFFAA